MMRFAIIENGIVTNIAQADEAFGAEQDWKPAGDDVQIGWTWSEEDGLTAPVVPLDELKARLWGEVKAMRDGMVDAPGAVAATPFGAVQVDAKSKANINGLVTMALIANGAGAPFSEPFTLADNSIVTLSAPQMIGLGVAVGRFVAAAHSRSRALRAAIDSAPDSAALAAIDIAAGWP